MRFCVLKSVVKSAFLCRKRAFAGGSWGGKEAVRLSRMGEGRTGMEVLRLYSSRVKRKVRYLEVVEGFSVTMSFSLPKCMRRWSSRFSVR